MTTKDGENSKKTNSSQTKNENGLSKNEKGGKEKGPPPGLVIPPKKPKLSKAERRALQEAQRAAKEASSKGGQQGNKKVNQPKKKDGDLNVDVVAGKKNSRVNQVAGGESVEKTLEEKPLDEDDRTLRLFSHLPPYKDPASLEEEFTGIKLGSKSTSSLHPIIIALGQKYSSGEIRGGNARCKAMLRAFQIIVAEYTPSPNAKDMRQDLDHKILKPAFQYWTTRCRIHSVTMGNAFSFFKLAVANLDRDTSLEDMKEILSETIDAYIQERIEFADRAISENASTKIVDGDVILTFAKSDVVESILINAATSRDQPRNFRVICVDSRPMLEGRELVQSLTSAGIECTYTLLNSLSYVMMGEVTKVFLGAAALMSDGSILSRVGTACVALMAHSNNIPVLFCCESYKISTRVQLESITGNELGNPQDLVSTKCAFNHYNVPTINRNEASKDTLYVTTTDRKVLENWQNIPNLKLLNLSYDLTPSKFVSGIVTEMGILPPTSVAVLLREMNPQDNDSTFRSQVLF